MKHFVICLSDSLIFSLFIYLDGVPYNESLFRGMFVPSVVPHLQLLFFFSVFLSLVIALMLIFLPS